MLLRSARLRALGAHTIDVAVDGAAPPTEFRLFKAGPNETTKGTFLFDAEAATAVMAAAAQRDGVDYPIDLEHLSLESTDSRGFDPDARGWFCLAVRNGELWAVNVRWTPDGQRRLSERTQRYVSPAFTVDDDNRVTEIVNVALVAMPATHGTPALVAANRRSHAPMPKTAKDIKTQLAVRVALARQKITKLADGDTGGDSAPSGKFAAVQAAANGASEALAALESVTGVDEAMGALDAALAAVKAFEDAAAAMGSASTDAPETEVAEEPAAASADPAATDEEKKMSRVERAELLALRRRFAAAEEDAKIQRLAIEMQRRQGLESELVKLGVQTPATVKLLGALSVDDLEKMVAPFRGKPPAGLLSRITPPSSPSTGDGSKEFVTRFGTVTLTANQLAECERAGAKPEIFAEHAARRTVSKG